MRKMVSGTLMQDARDTRLLVRFYGCDNDYNVSMIVVGWDKDLVGTAEVSVHS